MIVSEMQLTFGGGGGGCCGGKGGFGGVWWWWWSEVVMKCKCMDCYIHSMLPLLPFFLVPNNGVGVIGKDEGNLFFTRFWVL